MRRTAPPGPAELTKDIERFVGFYTEIFGADIIAELDEDGLRHAMLDIGFGAALHVFEQRGNPDARASMAISDAGTSTTSR